MNAYEVHTVYSSAERYLVVAKSYGDAEKSFLEKYPGTPIDRIAYLTGYVLVAKATTPEGE